MRVLALILSLGLSGCMLLPKSVWPDKSPDPKRTQSFSGVYQDEGEATRIEVELEPEIDCSNLNKKECPLIEVDHVSGECRCSS